MSVVQAIFEAVRGFGEQQPLVGGAIAGLIAMAVLSLVLRGRGGAATATAGRPGAPDPKQIKAAQKARMAEQKARQKQAQEQAKAMRKEKEQQLKEQKAQLKEQKAQLEEQKRQREQASSSRR